ncbi:hypothetical protein K493DRAFT_333861 [Basidiobolus meristosporus CBS 931.73]|uniref:Serpin domain-containing protein n=1 Tax=Basidiobolus meristosporus CBS 931.73 TaxID=1314790 RepID=A0A1Y1Z3S0_9FUNG|nr:hypothetical protein K493DRAFT_333861 [Basidiobolus meristosporus CBS 931.73]|eukprot:ORY04617.1 hypothetical protein K493DRAFT_333861 [Basidiobolus meristosporus CBS 931.73]
MFQGEHDPTFIELEKHEELLYSAIRSISESLSLSLLQTKDQNVLFSPASVTFALLLLVNGTSKETQSREEILDAFKLPSLVNNSAECLDLVNNAAQDLLNELLNRDGSVEIPSDRLADLEVANSIWGEGIHQSYLEKVSALFSAEAFPPPEDGRRVNAWIEKKTKGHLKEFFSPEQSFSNTVIMLINSVYFHGRWLHPFGPDDTKSAPFSTPLGKQLDASMMTIEGKTWEYAERESYQVLHMPYKDYRFLATIVLPKEAVDFQKASTMMNPEEWKHVFLERKMKARGTVILPKFDLESQVDLSQALKDAGIRRVFDAREANLGELTDGSLAVDSILHKCRIEVDESGSKASAATAVILTRATHLQVASMTIGRAFTRIHLTILMNINTEPKDLDPMVSLSFKKETLLKDITILLNCLSASTSLLIIVLITAIYSYNSKYADRVSFRIAFLISWVDLFYAIFLILSYVSAGPTSFCTFVAWGALWTDLLYIFLNIIVALNLQVVFLHGTEKIRHFENLLVCGSFICATVISLGPTMHHKLGYDPARPSSCWFIDLDSGSTLFWEWAAQHIWIILGCIYLSTVSLLTVIKLFRHTNHFPQVSHECNPAVKRMVNMAVRRIVLYPIVPILTHTSKIVFLSSEFFGIEYPFPLRIIGLSATSSQGILNAAVFLFDPAIYVIWKATRGKRREHSKTKVSYHKDVEITFISNTREENTEDFIEKAELIKEL